MYNSITPVRLPYLKQEENGFEPQYITSRNHYSSRLYVDTRVGYESTDPSSSVQIKSARGLSNPLVMDSVRRIAVKKWGLFFYVDNIIAGYNDTINFGFLSTNPPLFQTWTGITLDAGFYQAEDLGQHIADKLQAWLDANWGSVPIPTVNYTFVDPFASAPGLLGQIKLSISYGIGTTNLSIDPECDFIVNSGAMFNLTRSNSYPIPTNDADDPYLKLSVFSLTPYIYIDVMCTDLTDSVKLRSTNNVSTNYNVIYRINNPQYGWNEYIETENLFWINQEPDKSVFTLNLQFIGPNGREIRGAITRDFWSTIEFALQ